MTVRDIAYRVTSPVGEKHPVDLDLRFSAILPGKYVGSYSSGPPAARIVGTKSTGGLFHISDPLLVCIYMQPLAPLICLEESYVWAAYEEMSIVQRLWNNRDLSMLIMRIRVC